MQERRQFKDRYLNFQSTVKIVTEGIWLLKN